MCLNNALFIVRTADEAEEVSARTCGEHLRPAVEAANTDYDYTGAHVYLLNHSAGFTCEWIEERGDGALDGCTCSVTRGAHRADCPWAMGAPAKPRRWFPQLPW